MSRLDQQIRLAADHYLSPDYYHDVASLGFCYYAMMYIERAAPEVYSPLGIYARLHDRAAEAKLMHYFYGRGQYADYVGGSGAGRTETRLAFVRELRDYLLSLE